MSLFYDNNEKNKKEWIKYEKQLKTRITCILIVVIFLIVVIIFFPTQVWAIITGLAVITGLILNLINLLNIRKGR